MEPASKNSNIIESNLFDVFLGQYDRSLNKSSVEAEFDIPEVLKDIVKVVFLHNKHKTVNYRSIPKDTIFVDNVDTCLQQLNPMINRETGGFFSKLDETTVKNMRKTTFRSAVVAFFYLEGLWSADLFNERPFHNRDGSMVEKVPYFSFKNVCVVISNGILKANVNYVVKHNEPQRDRVCFTMPVESKYEDGIYEKAVLLVPQVDLKYRREEADGYDTMVINFAYKHDEFGFVAAGLYSKVSCDGGRLLNQMFYLDHPFKVGIYHKGVKVLKVSVENLENSLKS